jgi:ubiquinone/menaquinone biosynthesis C-methylase UbiE
MSGASTLEVYERWAPRYPPDVHNPLMVAEQREMLARLPDVTGARVLDLACGTGRYARLLERAGARHVVGIDFSMAMLRRASGARVRGDLCALPLRSRCFDLVVSGLALGHAADLAGCARECARVLEPGGRLLYSDFHPEASRKGLKRGFRDERNEHCELPVAEHLVGDHLAALERAGFVDVELAQIRAGFEFTGQFPGGEEFCREWRGTPLLFVLSARKPA